MGCHRTDSNGAVIDSYLWHHEGGVARFDDSDAPPQLAGIGGRVQGDWSFDYLFDAETVRPWLMSRMPTFDLPEDQATQWVEYVAAIDAVPPFAEPPPPPASPEQIADGETLFAELQCLQCHVFGDPTAPGANTQPTAPDLQRTADRLRHAWVERWLRSPRAILPGTRMPSFFGDGHTSALAADSPEDRAAIAARLHDKSILDDAGKQIESIRAFLYDASANRRNIGQAREAHHGDTEAQRSEGEDSGKRE